MAQSVTFQFFRRTLSRLFSSKYLLVTNTAISVSLSGAGDILQQKYEHLRGGQDPWNATRTRNQCISGSIIGPTCHFWYLWLDRVLPGRAVRVVVKKMLLDQVVMTPVCLTQFLSVTSWLEGKNKKQLITEFQTKGVTLFITDLLIWPPAQLVNFFLVPTRFRVLYDNTISLCFDCYYSYVKYQKDYSDHHCFKEADEMQSESGTSTAVETETVGLADSLSRDICCDMLTMSSKLDGMESSVNIDSSIYSDQIDASDISEHKHSSQILYCCVG